MIIHEMAMPYVKIGVWCAMIAARNIGAHFLWDH